MPILSDQDRKTLETRFKKDLKRDVTLTLFTARSFGGLILPGRECQTCDQTEELLNEITEISSHINLTVKDFYTEAEEAQERGIDRIPCITLQAEGDEPSNLLFYGIPAGFEILTLIEDIVAASRGVSPLQLTTRKALRKLETEVHIQVFVTPGWPHCPTVARLAHAMAMETTMVRAEVVEAQEFPHLSQLHRVQAVPKTIINGVAEVLGAVPEATLLERILSTIGQEDLLEGHVAARPEEAPIGPTSAVGS